MVTFHVPSSAELLLFTGIANATSFLFLLVLIVSFLIKLVKHRAALKTKRMALLSLIILFIFTAFSGVTFAASGVSIYGHFIIHQDLSSLEQSIGKPSIPLYFIAQSLMILLFTIRIHKTFQCTVYKVSQKRVFVLYFNSILLIVVPFSFPMVMILHGNVLIALIPLCMWIMLHFVMSITLMRMFTKRMIMNIKIRDDADKSMTSLSTTTSSSKTTTQIQEAIRNEDLLQLLVKHNVLVSTVILSTLFFFIINVALIGMVMDASIRFIVALFWSLDSVVSATCIYLFFQFNDGAYSKLCPSLHRWCTKAKVNKMQNSNTI